MASESKSAPAAESDTYKAVCVVVAGNASTDAEITRRVRDSVCAGLTSYSDIYHVVTRAQLEEYAALSGWKQGAATLVRALRAFLASDAADGSDPAATLEVLRARQAGDGGGGAAKKGPKGQLDAATISKLLGRDEKPKRNPEPRPPAAVSRIVLLHDFPESPAEAEAVLSGAAAPPAAQGSELAVGADQKYLHAVLDLRRTYDGAPVVREAAQATGPTPEELGVPLPVSGPVERRASVPVNMIDFGKPPPPEPEPEPEPQVEAKGEEGDAGEGDGAGDGDGGDEDGDGGSKAGDGDAGDEAGAADAADDAGAGGEKEDDDLGDAEEDDDEDDSDAEPVAEKEPEEELPPEEEVVIETTKGGIDLWRDQANAKAGGDWDAVDFKDVTIDDFRGVPAADEVLVPQLHEVLVKIAKDRLRYEEWMAITTTEVPQGGKEADTAELVDLYSAVLQGAPEVAVDTPLIMFALREAVALGADAAPSDEPVDASLLDWAAQLDTCVPIEEGDASLLGVCRAAQEVGKGPKELLVGEAVADVVEAVPEYAATPVASAVRAVVRQARFPGAPGRLGMPDAPTLQSTERGASMTELSTFTPLPEYVITRTQLLREFEGLLQTADDAVAPEELRSAGKRDPDSFQWSLHEWRCYQDRSPAVVQQALAEALATDPEVHKTYHPPSDRLLVAVHHPTPRSRHRDTVFCARDASTLPLPFARWQGAGLGNRPAWAPVPPSFFAIDADAARASVHVTRRLFPADHGLIRLQANADRQWWLSVHRDGHLFGLRMGAGPRDSGATGGSAAAAAAAKQKKAAAAKRAAASAMPTSERGFTGALPELPQVRAPKGGSGDGYPYRFYASFAASRSSGPAFCVVDEGPACPTKPDGKGSIVVANTCASGLVVENCSQGWVRQTPPEPLAYTSSGPRETCRSTVGCRGTTVVHLEDGYRKVLYADGSVAWFLPEDGGGKWLVVEPSGARYMKVGGNRVPMEPVRLTRTVDPEAKATVSVRHDPCPITGAGAAGGLDRMKPKRSKSRGPRRGNKAKSKRKQAERDAAVAKYWEERKVLQGALYTAAAPDGGIGGRVVVVEYESGDRLVLHADGTHIATTRVMSATARDGDAPSEHVVVASPGYASVEVEVATEQTAQRHAAGQRVAITRSGMQTRSVTYLPDGTTVAHDYDTKITTTTNGRVRMHKPDGVVIVARDGGMVEYRPAGTSDTVAARAALGCGNVEQEVRVAGGDDDEDDGRQTPRSVRSEVDTDSGAYVLDLEVGDMQVTDPESNSFQVFMTGHVVTDLAGTIGGMGVIPRVGNPVPPRLFTMDGAGGATELLAPSVFERMRDLAVPVSDADGFFPLLAYTAEESGAAARSPSPRGAPSPMAAASPSRSVQGGGGTQRTAAGDASRRRGRASPAYNATGAGVTASQRSLRNTARSGRSRRSQRDGGGDGDGVGGMTGRSSVRGGGLAPLAETAGLTGALTLARKTLGTAALGKAVEGVPPSYIGKTVSLPPSIAPASYTRTAGSEGKEDAAPNPSLNHTFLTLTVGAGPSGGAGAAAAPGRRDAQVPHAVGVADVRTRRAGLVSVDGRCVLRGGTEGWIGYLSSAATPDAPALAVPSVVAGRPAPCGAARVALVYREVIEHDQLDPTQRAAMEDSEAKCEQWRKDVAATINRFAVDDHRPDEVRVQEILLARRILKQRAPKKKKKRGRRRYGGGSNQASTATDIASAKPSRSPVGGGVGTPTIMEAVDEGDMVTGSVSARGAADAGSAFGGDDLPKFTGERKTSPRNTGGGAATASEASPRVEMTDAERAAAQRAAIRDRAKRRAMERTQKRRAAAAAGGTSTVGSFWRTAQGKELAMDAAMDAAATRSASPGGASASPDPGDGEGETKWGHSDSRTSLQDHHVAGTGVAAVRRLSSRNLVPSGESPAATPSPEPVSNSTYGGNSGVGQSTRDATDDSTGEGGGIGGSAQPFPSARSFRSAALAREAFEVSPSQVRFGEVRAGGVYRFPIKLRNTSVDAARFRIDVAYIQHAPAGNSLRLVTLQPGKVAPGMSVTVDVELQAQVLGMFSSSVEIATEAGLLSIPVVARVQRSGATKLARGVQAVSASDAQVDETTMSSAYRDGRPHITLDSTTSRRGTGGAAAAPTSGSLTAAEQYLAPVPGSQDANQTFDDAEAEERMLRLLRAE